MKSVAGDFSPALGLAYRSDAGLGQSAIAIVVAVINTNVLVGFTTELSIQNLSSSGPKTEKAAFGIADVIECVDLRVSQFLHRCIYLTKIFIKVKPKDKYLFLHLKLWWKHWPQRLFLSPH